MESLEIEQKLNAWIFLSQVKVHTKDELHQWDDLKQNQRAHLEDLEQHWSSRGDTFTQAAEGYSLAGEEAGEAVLFAPHWEHNSTEIFGTKDQTETAERKGAKNPDGTKTVSSVDIVDSEVKVVEGGDVSLPNRTEGKTHKETGNEDEGAHTVNLWQEDKSKIKGHTSGFPHVTQSPLDKPSPTEANGERAGSRVRPTKEPNPEPREQARRRDNETPQVLLSEEEKMEQKRKELLLLHKNLGPEKEILRQQQTNREEEERMRGKETDSQHHPHGKHHHHHLQIPTTQKPGNYWVHLSLVWDVLLSQSVSILTFPEWSHQSKSCTILSVKLEFKVLCYTFKRKWKSRLFGTNCSINFYTFDFTSIFAITEPENKKPQNPKTTDVL